MVDSPLTFVFEIANQEKLELAIFVEDCKLIFAWYGEEQLVILNGVKIGIGFTTTVCEHIEIELLGIEKFWVVSPGSFGLTVKVIVKVCDDVSGFVSTNVGGVCVEFEA